MTYITLYHTYQLLNYKGHIHMTSNYSTIDVYKKTIESINKYQLHIQYT